jgi:alpha-ketoglutarate-dependent taurine dioxygenase
MSMASRFQPLSPRIGARAVMSRPELMDPAFAAECLEALERYGVLIFPALGLSDEEQIIFSGRLGDVIPMGGKRADGTRDPIFMLSARRISAVGGQTEFCNSYAAYDDLPESEKPHCESLRIGHSLEAANRLTTPNPTDKDLAIWRARGGVKEHPLVWRHNTGRKSLVLGATAGYVAGLSSEDSRALLAKLEAHATRREIVYRHEWQMGDLVIWDNCGTMHRVIPYDPSSGRMMHRTTLHGVEAIA